MSLQPVSYISLQFFLEHSISYGFGHYILVANKCLIFSMRIIWLQTATLQNTKKKKNHKMKTLTHFPVNVQSDILICNQIAVLIHFYLVDLSMVFISVGDFHFINISFMGFKSEISLHQRYLPKEAWNT